LQSVQCTAARTWRRGRVFLRQVSLSTFVSAGRYIHQNSEQIAIHNDVSVDTALPTSLWSGSTPEVESRRFIQTFDKMLG
jgi:hypothetical protein